LEQAPAAPSPEDWRASGTVLIVDDDENARSVAEAVCRSAGFRTLQAADGRAGVEAFRRHSAEITVVLLDLTMPHLGGEEAFAEMRLVRADVPVILMSGYQEQEVTSRFAGRGLAAFVQKPFRAEDLTAILRRVLEPKQP
jgi:DNA-binding NtrC family response regulator